MVTIGFVYETKTGDWKRGELEFDNPYKARKFLYVIRNSRDKILENISCTDSDEYDIVDID